MPAMTASLDKSITKLNEDLMTQFTTLHTGEFVDPVCDPKAPLRSPTPTLTPTLTLSLTLTHTLALT